jgi:eukaryotic-like serine/threonine-protein kinase
MSVSQALVAERYRLLQPLGAGGMGRVWLARDEMLRRNVAIKEVVPPDGLTESERDELRRRTLREARAAARLNHPNVVRIYDVIHTEQRPWIVMEYIPSRSLHQVVNTDGPLPPERAAQIGLAVLAALRAAHAAGVMHRDVKPGNVLLADDGRVVLTDFGLATFDGGDGTVTRPGLILGSPQYISPERARDGVAGTESDLWSLGATLYAAVEGHAPYARATTWATLTALATEEPDPMHRAGPLKSVINSLLRKDPKSRAKPEEVERLLLRTLAGEGRLWRLLPRQRRIRDAAAAAGLGSGSGGSGGAASQAPVSGAPVSGAPVSGAPVSGAPVSGSGAPVGTATPVSAPPLSESSSGSGDRTTADLSGTPAPPKRRRRRLLTLTTVTVVAAIVAGLITWTDFRDRLADGERPVNPSRSASIGGPGAATPDPEPDGAPTPRASVPFELPVGFVQHIDPTGFKIAVPRGWTPWRDEGYPQMVYFRDLATGSLLGIDQTNQPKMNPVEDWREKETQRVRGGDLPQYQHIHIGEVNFHRVAADWEYTYVSRGVRLHVMNRGFVNVAATKGYAIYWQMPDSVWQANLWKLQDVIYPSFIPAA